MRFNENAGTDDIAHFFYWQRREERTSGAMCTRTDHCAYSVYHLPAVQHVPLLYGLCIYILVYTRRARRRRSESAIAPARNAG